VDGRPLLADVLLEGYDLVALGVGIPTLLKSGYLGFTAVGATAVATVSLVGVAVGAVLGLTSVVGRLGSILGPFVTGALVTAGVAYPWGFYFFAVVAAFGLVAVLMLRNEARAEPAAV
jgi:hypothetical protein